MAFKDWTLRKKITIPSVILILLVTALVGLVVAKQQHTLAIDRSRSTAQAIHHQVMADREFYTSEVVGKLLRDEVPFTTGDIHTYKSTKGRVHGYRPTPIITATIIVTITSSAGELGLTHAPRSHHCGARYTRSDPVDLRWAALA